MNYKFLYVLLAIVFYVGPVQAYGTDPLLELVYRGEPVAVQNFLEQHAVKRATLYKALNEAAYRCQVGTVEALVNSQYKSEYDKPDTKLFVNTAYRNAIAEAKQVVSDAVSVRKNGYYEVSVSHGEGVHTERRYVKTASEQSAWAVKERDCSQIVTYLTELESARVIRNETKMAAENANK